MDCSNNIEKSLKLVMKRGNCGYRSNKYKYRATPYKQKN